MSKIEPLVPPVEGVELIRRATHIAILTHISPDGDAVGSALGLAALLWRMEKEPVVVCQDPLPRHFHFLPGFASVRRGIKGDVELIIGIDASDPSRLGQPLQNLVDRNLPLFVIDHHITNVHFGTVDWVEPMACSAAEMVFYLAKALAVPLDKEIATCILTGMLTDTRGLRTSNVTNRTLQVVAELTEAGALFSAITELVLNHYSLAQIRLWAEALPQVKIRDGIIWTTITQEMRRRTGLRNQHDGGLVSFLTAADEAYIGIVFTENAEGKVEVSIRSVPGVNVADVALALGGGGHPQAAGCVIDGPLGAAAERVVAALHETLKAQLTAHPSLQP